MTQEQDIVERLLDICENDDHERGCQGREYDCTCGFDERIFATAKEAAQTIDALLAERDEAVWVRNAWYKLWQVERRDRNEAETRAKELERQAIVDFGQIQTALEERDEARKALKPFAKEADHWDDIPGVVKTHDNVELWQNPKHRTPITVGDLRRARSASSNREGGEE